MQPAKQNDSAVDHGARQSHKVDPSLGERMGWRWEAGRKEEQLSSTFHLIKLNQDEKLASARKSAADSYLSIHYSPPRWVWDACPNRKAQLGSSLSPSTAKSSLYPAFLGHSFLQSWATHPASLWWSYPLCLLLYIRCSTCPLPFDLLFLTTLLIAVHREMSYTAASNWRGSGPPQ